jgi:hypothetical protein
MTAVVYVSWGRVVADCFCGDARELKLGQKTMTCCVNEKCPGHVSKLVWPDDMAEILAALNERTDDRNRTWFPKNHPLALSNSLPHGQTAAELREEEVS